MLLGEPFKIYAEILTKLEATKLSEFRFSQADFQAQIDRTRQRRLVRERLFVLLLGPSATGKSTIIQELNGHGVTEEFAYVKPIITRPNRPGETDKVSVSDDIFSELDAKGEFVVVNELYGVRYGTPLSGILTPLAEGRTPILDYPLDRVDALRRPEYDTLNFYVFPSSTQEWVRRVESSGRNTSGRLEAGLGELSMLAASEGRHPAIDISVINANGSAHEAAHTIRYAIDTITG